MIDFPPKEVGDVADYLFDFTAALQESEGIASKTVAANGVTVASSEIVDVDAVTDAGVRVWLSGGTEGSVARVTVTIVTNSVPARTFVETAVLPIGGGPIDLARAKAHLRIDFDTEDALIRAYLRAAVASVEKESARVLSPRAVTQNFAGFVGRDGRRALTLSAEPVIEIVTVEHVDSDGAVVTLDPADYRSIEGEPWSLIEPLNGSWPPVETGRRDAVRVRAIAGYETGECPPDLQAAVLLMLGHLYANREAVTQGGSTASAPTELPLGVKALCFPFRRVLIG